MSVYDIRWNIGAHTCFSGKICDTLWTGVNYGMYATQFFMGSSLTFDRADISFEDIRESKKILKKYPMHVFSHFPYVANLAGSTKSLAWSGDDSQDRKTLHMLKSLEYELSILSNFDSSRNGVVIHPGSHKDHKKGIEAIAKSINKISFTENAKLILENSAGQGTTIASTFEEIKNIIDLVDPKKRNNIGVCVDTCHAYSAGLYDLSIIEEVNKMFQDFDRIIGLDRLTLFHLNDSIGKFKCKTDNHACLGTGCIWGKSFDSLLTLLNTAQKHGIPLVLETHGIDMVTLACL